MNPKIAYMYRVIKTSLLFFGPTAVIFFFVERWALPAVIAMWLWLVFSAWVLRRPKRMNDDK